MKLVSIIVIAAFISTACGATQKQPAAPLKVTLLPPEIDVDKLIPPEPDETVNCNEKAVRFEDRPITHAKENGEALPPGILVDECTYAKENISDQSTLKRLRKELDIRSALRTQEMKIIRETEMKYQETILKLEDKAQRNWWERNALEIGVAAGILTTIGVIFGVNAAQNASR